MGPTQLIWSLILATSLNMGSCQLNPEANNSEICYGELGCFSNDAPFNNTLNRLPRYIVVTFRLFTETCTTPYILHSGDTEYTSACNFDPELPLKFVVHGFRQTGEDQWVRDMAGALLDKEPMSVISVDWGSGSGHPYLQAAANTRVVGAEISRLIQSLHAHADVSPEKVHIIGYSLGAHIAGYAGQRIDGLGRITGLDPAEPRYKDTDPLVHLDKTDAKFVDIIHTDGSEDSSGFGLMEDTGHMDFYPNGGEKQPGCSGNILLGRSRLSCSHSRSIYLFIESINSTCPFYGHPCGSIVDLDSNKRNCLACPRGACPQMGYNADKSFARGKFYLRTRAERPFCGYTHYVEIAFDSMDPVNGEIAIEMIGQDQTSDSVAIKSGNDPFMSESQRGVFVLDSMRITDVAKVNVTFNQYWLLWWSAMHSVTIHTVTITSPVDGQRVHFCGDNRTVTDGSLITLNRSTTDTNECLLMPAMETVTPGYIEIY